MRDARIKQKRNVETRDKRQEIRQETKDDKIYDRRQEMILVVIRQTIRFYIIGQMIRIT